MHFLYSSFVLIFCLNKYLIVTEILWGNGAMRGPIGFHRPNSWNNHLNVAIYRTCWYARIISVFLLLSVTIISCIWRTSNTEVPIILYQGSIIPIHKVFSDLCKRDSAVLQRGIIRVKRRRYLLHQLHTHYGLVRGIPLITSACPVGRSTVKRIFLLSSVEYFSTNYKLRLLGWGRG